MSVTVSDISKKFQVGAAACAIVGATALASGPIASANPGVPVPAAGLGSSLDALCEEGDEACLSPFAASSDGRSNAMAASPIQNDFIWFGAIPDPAPENIAMFEYNIIPLFSQPIQDAAYAWWESVIPNGINLCVLGATAKIDSYSTLSVGFTKGCSG